MLLNKLVEKGYVYREEDKKDRRNTLYEITKEKSEILDEQKNEVYRSY
ncbi:winged helix DNA-binding protein [Romboutsia ilealis]|nr:winged helix DNA-binding protein [Romboutsia ilealis]